PPLSACLLPPPHPHRPTLFPYTTLFRSILFFTSTAFSVTGFACDTDAKDNISIPASNRARSGRQSPALSDKARPHACRACRSWQDRKSTRLNSSHVSISYAVFCLKKKKS